MVDKVSSNPMEVRKLRHSVSWYVVVGDRLYYSVTKESTLLFLCMSREEGKAIAIIIHRGANGAHQGGQDLCSASHEPKSILGFSFGFICLIGLLHNHCNIEEEGKRHS